MGCIPNKSQRGAAASTSTKAFKNLNELKDALVYQNCRLHNLALSCKSAIEKLLLSSDKERAVVLKNKEFIIKNQLECLRSAVQSIDEYEDSEQRDKKKKNQIIEECMASLKIISNIEFTDDVDELVNLQSNYWVSVKKELGKYEINQENIVILIEHEYQKLKSNSEGSMKRRRYSKKHRVTV